MKSLDEIRKMYLEEDEEIYFLSLDEVRACEKEIERKSLAKDYELYQYLIYLESYI